MTTRSRRSFLQFSGLGVATWLVSGWMSCSKATDMISNLRGILEQVEKALAALSLLGGLLPDAVNTAAKYLTAVCEFVINVDNLLLDELTSAADKTRQIMAWAGALVFPVIPPPIGPILQMVATAVDKFLSLFGTDVAHARSAQVSNPPDMTLNDKQKAELRTLLERAKKDEQAVDDWQKKAMATPAK